MPRYADVASQARQQAVERMMQHARELGATAVLGVPVDSCDVAENLAEILAYGTAVRVSPAS